MVSRRTTATTIQRAAYQNVRDLPPEVRLEHRAAHRAPVRVVQDHRDDRREPEDERAHDRNRRREPDQDAERVQAVDQMGDRDLRRRRRTPAASPPPRASPCPPATGSRAGHQPGFAQAGQPGTLGRVRRELRQAVWLLVRLGCGAVVVAGLAGLAILVGTHHLPAVLSTAVVHLTPDFRLEVAGARLSARGALELRGVRLLVAATGEPILEADAVAVRASPIGLRDRRLDEVRLDDAVVTVPATLPLGGGDGTRRHVAHRPAREPAHPAARAIAW